MTQPHKIIYTLFWVQLDILFKVPSFSPKKKKIQRPPKQQEIDLTVAAVIAENNHWDLCYISMQLPTEITTFIQAIPLSYTQSNAVYQELKSNESKNEREEKKGLKNKKKQKKELNDTAS